MSTRRRRILLTNDDGIRSPGLLALLEPLGRLGEVTVVAPADEQSGVSHGIVYLRPVTCERRQLPHDVEAFAVDAFPADCVKLAMDQLMPEKPDLVVSGINRGANVGRHVFYSGTVAAALEASMMGVPGLAVSLAVARGRDLLVGAGEVDRSVFDRAAAAFMDVLRVLDGMDLGRSPAINVNIPPGAQGIRGVRWAAQFSGPMPDTYEGAGGSDGRRLYQMQMAEQPRRPEADSDRTLLEAGFVTVTPMRCDLTCRETLDRLKRNPLSLEGRGPG